MHIRLINPNSTQSMTDQALASALKVKLAETIITAVNPAQSPVSIEGAADEAIAIPAMLQEIIAGEQAGIDAYILACFDDPGLNAAREIARGPVIGICQAAIQIAMTISRRFSIITTLPRSVPLIEDLVLEYGAERHCRKVRSINLPVLGLEENPGAAENMLAAEIERAKVEDGAEAVILGCAGMAAMCEKLNERCGLPVIDGVVAATKIAEALVSAGYLTSKLNAYDYPRQKAGALVAPASL